MRKMTNFWKIFTLSVVVGSLSFGGYKEIPSAKAQAEKMTPVVKEVELEEGQSMSQAEEGLLPEVEVDSQEKNYSNEVVKAMAASLPTKYPDGDITSQTYLSPIRNQSPFGSCWAHAAMACMETSAIRKGIVSEPDFSEKHLAYFAVNHVTDPLGGTAGDGTVIKGEDNYLQNGGNNDMASMTLSQWMGAASESADASLKYPGDVPRSQADNYNESIDDKFAYMDQVHLKNTEVVAKEDTEIIKEKIMQYGIGAVSYYHNDSEDVYKDKYSVYYQNQQTGTNHAVCVVGWDDNYPRTNFSASLRPSKNGAWLIRNSWGTNSSFNGYMWISYEDTSLSNVYFYEVEQVDDKLRNYQYDGSCTSRLSGYSAFSDMQVANVFTVHGQNKGAESLERVSLYTFENNVPYTLQIYRNPSSENPISGTLEYSGEGELKYPGFHSIDLENRIEFMEGETFSVVFVLHSNSSKGVYCAVDQTVPGTWLDHNSSAQAGQSFMRPIVTGHNYVWSDISASNGNNARIKGFTRLLEAPSVIEDVSLSHDINIRQRAKLSLVVNATPKTSCQLLKWKSLDETVATVDQNGVVTPKRGGKVTIQVTSAIDDTVKCSINVNVNLPYSILFDGNGANGGEMDNQSMAYLTKGALSANKYTKTGYTFKGWATTKTATEAEYTNQQEVTTVGGLTGLARDPETITLYAVWEANPYSVAYNGNGADQGEMAASSMIYDRKASLSPNQYQHMGHLFMGWALTKDAAQPDFQDEEEIINLLSEANSNVVLYAVWKPITYTIKFHGGDGIDQGSTMDSQTATYGVESALDGNTFVRTGYLFTGWKTGENEEEISFEDGDRVISLAAEQDAVVDMFATWEPITYSVDFYCNCGDKDCEDVKEQTLTYDTPENLLVNSFAKTGYTFAGWSLNQAASKIDYLDMEVVKNLSTQDGGRVSLYAVWKEKYYDLSFDGNGCTSGSAVSVRWNFDEERELPDTIFEKTGYELSGWDTNPAAPEATYALRQRVINLTDIPEGAVTLFAIWAPHHYTVNFYANEGMGTMQSQKFVYDEAQALSKNKFTREGYVFAGWSTSQDGDVIYEDQQEITNLTSDKDVEINLFAQWEKQATPSPKPTAAPNPIGPGVVPPRVGESVADVRTQGVYQVTTSGQVNTVTYQGSVNKTATSVTVPDVVVIAGRIYNVTAVADNAFLNNKVITKVTLGANVISVGKNAFGGCTKLKTIVIGKNVTKLAKNIFKGCKKIKNITIKTKKLDKKGVAKGAFAGLKKGTVIKVPKSKRGAYKKLFKSKGLSSKVKVKA